MFTKEYDGSTQIVVVGIAPGEMLLETVEKAIRENDVQNGAVVSGIGTLKTCQLHYIKDTEFPPTDVFHTLEKPLELLSVSGIIADGVPHLHVVVSCGEDEVFAGHLEPNSEVLYLAEIAIQKFNPLRLTRELEPVKKVKLLAEQK